MPKKFIRKSFGKKRNRRFRKKLPVSMITKTFKTPRGPFSRFNSVDPFPLQYNCKFVYSMDSYLSNTASSKTVGTIQEFRLNSPYDPNYTSISATASNTSCYGFSKICNDKIYRRYKVNAVKIDLVWFDPIGVDTLMGIAKLKGVSDGGTISSLNLQYLERSPMTVIKRVSDSGTQRRRVVQYVPLSQLSGWTKQAFKLDYDTTTGPYNNNPSSVPLLQLGVANSDDTDGTVRSMRYRLTLTYYTTLYDRNSMAGEEAPV